MYGKPTAAWPIYYTAGGSYFPGELDGWLCIPGEVFKKQINIEITCKV